jgi:hypothetical protein
MESGLPAAGLEFSQHSETIISDRWSLVNNAHEVTKMTPHVKQPKQGISEFLDS